MHVCICLSDSCIVLIIIFYIFANFSAANYRAIKFKQAIYSYQIIVYTVASNLEDYKMVLY